MLEKCLQLQTELYCNEILYFDSLPLLPSKIQGKLFDLNIGLDQLLSHGKDHYIGYRHTKLSACKFILQTTCSHKRIKEIMIKLESMTIFLKLFFPSLMHVVKLYK